MQLSFYGFGPSSSCSSLPTNSSNVQLKNHAADGDEDRDESSQDSGIGTEFKAPPPHSSCESASVLGDRTNLMDEFLSTGRLRTNRHKPVFMRSLSLPVSAVSEHAICIT